MKHCTQNRLTCNTYTHTTILCRHTQFQFTMCLESHVFKSIHIKWIWSACITPFWELLFFFFFFFNFFFFVCYLFFSTSTTSLICFFVFCIISIFLTFFNLTKKKKMKRELDEERKSRFFFTFLLCKTYHLILRSGFVFKFLH